jgi:hypothetical protein
MHSLTHTFTRTLIRTRTFTHTHTRTHAHTHSLSVSVPQRTGVRLEHPFLASLYQTLVLRGDYEGTEAALTQAATTGLFDEYLSQTPYQYAA